ncbi:receptor-like protein EIX2 isoform X2 [Silene latifolia]
MCKPSERVALLNFKHNLTYFDEDVSSTWEGDECCEWSRVVCDNTTGHILGLDLRSNGTNNFLKMKKLESLVYLLQLKQLEALDLSDNDFTFSSIPRFMGSMKQLRYLAIANASLGGLVPYELGNLTNLESLDLSYNNLSSIESSLRFPSNLEYLDLSYNNLSGKIPTSIGKLSKLQTLYISYNPLEGTVLSEPHLGNLSSLNDLEITNTMLTLNLSSDWVPPFQLFDFLANNSKINGQFPPWLQTQKNLTSLILSNANISGDIPSWFHTMQQLHFVYLSNNNLSGSPIFPINFSIIDLSYNSFSGSLFSNSSKTEKYNQAQEIYLQNNFITGPLPERLGNLMPNMTKLVVANNQIEGSVPNFLCQSTLLYYLDMQNNSLTGVIPNCWGMTLEILILSNNQIKGRIPDSLCQLIWLNFLDIQNNSLSGEIPNCLAKVSTLNFVRLSYNKLKGRVPCFNNTNGFFLHLNDNMLSGEIPSCISNPPNLIVLDIGGNQLTGKIDKWFSAEKLKNIEILRLRGNKFSGTIPREICSLPRLQIMDLVYNHFTGSIPLCLSNLTAMTSPNASLSNLFCGISEVIEGIERTYTSSLPYLVDIDLSCNNLVGSIPEDMTNITGLLNLNLSYNQLSGIIPENIGGLKSLISLDLSMNELRGRIPTSIGEIPMLSHLNLSYNNLSGQIPTGNQLQVLSDQALIYAGNRYLCADFLPKKCKSKADKHDNGMIDNSNGNNKEKLKKMGLDLVVMSGFATGFWGVVGCLVLNRRWRYAFFRRFEDGYNWLYVIVVLKVKAAKAKINNR